MKKTLSSQSLFNSRRSSVHKITIDSKELMTKDKIIQKLRIPSPITKPSITENKPENESKLQPNKNDIKEIYEYKIKQRAKKSKLLTQKSAELSKCKQLQLGIKSFEDSAYMEALKLENEKMSKQLCDMAKENKKLKELLLNADKNKIQAKTKVQSNVNTQKDYKKQMLTKLNDRKRLKTELTASFNKVNSNLNPYEKHEKKDKQSKQKSKNSRQKSREGSRNSITMNLNMSFVKIKSPSAGKNGQFIKNGGKQMIGKVMRSSSSKQLITFKEQFGKSNLISPKNQPQASIKSLFIQLSSKKQINFNDLQEFYFLNKKIFAEFNDLIMFSKQNFTELLNKTNISQCYDSKKLQDSKQSLGQNSKMKNLLDKIHELYKTNGNTLQHDIQNFGHKTQLSSGKKYNVSEIEPNELLTPESSVISFTEMHNNPEREKSYEKYRLKKLNENLGLIANFENKKLRTEITEPDSNEPKVYFSKPVSTNVSRKISFNNSFNNSLKNSKFE